VAGKVSALWAELTRRKVVRVGVLYLAAGYAVIEGADLILPRMGFADWTVTALIWLVIIGFPLALLISWAFDIGPEGLERTEARNDAIKGEAPFSVPEIALPFRELYIGREAERSRLQSLLERATAGRGGLILIGGEPGVGKSRLAEEAQAMGHALGMLPLTGHTPEERGAPFAPTIEILEELTRLLEPPVLRGLLGETAMELARLMPEWCALYDALPEPHELPPEQQQRRLFNALSVLLVQLSRQVPLVILLDDLHWADESSMLLLEHLSPQLATAPVLLIGTYREARTEQTDPFAHTLANLSRGDLVQRMSLKQFGRSEVSELLATLAGSEPPAEWVESIYSETEGNPFFVREVFAHLRESHELVDAAGIWKPAVDIEGIDVPEGVRLVIGRRLERMRDSTRDVLLVAAALGLRFRVGELSAVCQAQGLGGEAVLDELEEASAAQLISALPAQRDPRYEFAHALVRHTLLDRLSPSRLQALHGRVAAALDVYYGTGAGQRAALLARHYFEAGGNADVTRVRHFLRLAGEQAFAAAAYDEAHHWFDQALTVEEGSEAIERGALLSRRGMAHRAMQRWDQATADWEAALPILEQAGDASSVAEICRELGYLECWNYNNLRALAIVQRGLDAVGPGPSRDRARLLAIQAHASSQAGDYEGARHALDEAIPMAEDLDDFRLLGGEILLSQIYNGEHFYRGRQMVSAGERAIALVREHGTPWDQTSTISCTLLGRILVGDFATAQAYIDEIRPLAEQEGNIGALIHCAASGGIVALARGEIDRAFELSDDSVRLCRENKLPWVTLGLAWRSVGQLYRAEFEDALGSMDDIEADQLGPGTHQGGDMSHALLVRAIMGDVKAEAMLDENIPTVVAGRPNTSGAVQWSCSKIAAAAMLGRHSEAAALQEGMQQAIKDGATVAWALGLTERYAGIAAACGRQWGRAHAHFETALKQAGELPQRTEQVEARAWFAWALDLQGDQPERATQLRREAQSRTREMEMDGYLAQLESQLSRDSARGADEQSA